VKLPIICRPDARLYLPRNPSVGGAKVGRPAQQVASISGNASVEAQLIEQFGGPFVVAPAAAHFSAEREEAAFDLLLAIIFLPAKPADRATRPALATQTAVVHPKLGERLQLAADPASLLLLSVFSLWHLVTLTLGGVNILRSCEWG